VAELEQAREAERGDDAEQSKLEDQVRVGLHGVSLCLCDERTHRSTTQYNQAHSFEAALCRRRHMTAFPLGGLPEAGTNRSRAAKCLPAFVLRKRKPLDVDSISGRCDLSRAVSELPARSGRQVIHRSTRTEHRRPARTETSPRQQQPTRRRMKAVRCRVARSAAWITP
jgi:hypothetical protein